MFDVAMLEKVLVGESDVQAGVVTPIYFFTEKTLASWLEKQDKKQQAWIHSQDFEAKEGQFVYVPGAAGALDKVVAGLNKEGAPQSIGPVAIKLAQGVYQFANQDEAWQSAATLAWGKAGYRFAKFNPKKKHKAQLLWPSHCDRAKISHLLEAIYWIRDMENDPTETFSTPHLSREVERLAQAFGASYHKIVGDDLLEKNYPLVHAVGRAGANPPCFNYLSWGKESDPLVCLVGKGVCYDTGGLSIKTTAGMLLMKKDMGGAAHALGLAYLIMASQLPVRLKVFIPAVENAVSANSYRPGDVFYARNGLSVEITNTDAEGRLILADALSQAAESNPELIIDFATLTGAARVALGPDIAAAFSSPESIADDLHKRSPEHADPVGVLPLYEPYRKFLKSEIADSTNASSQPYGGAITAALFLKQFVSDHDWLHMDIPAWNTDAEAGGPGAEAMGLLTVWSWLQDRFS